MRSRPYDVNKEGVRIRLGKAAIESLQRRRSMTTLGREDPKEKEIIPQSQAV